jgi:hypothetical protein
MLLYENKKTYKTKRPIVPTKVDADDILLAYTDDRSLASTLVETNALVKSFKKEKRKKEEEKQIKLNDQQRLLKWTLMVL